MTNILVVEDDFAIRELICRTLAAKGYQMSQASCGAEAVSVVDRESQDLILLDVNLPDIDGFSLHRHLGNAPVIYITARDEIKDRLRGFELGAYDYLVKPFDLQELAARVQAVLCRKVPKKEEVVLQIGDLKIDLQTCSVSRGKQEIDLSAREFELLKAFAEHKNKVLSRQQLLELAWEPGFDGDLRTVDIHVQRLRKKLDLYEAIKTVFKIGYKLEIK